MFVTSKRRIFSVQNVNQSKGNFKLRFSICTKCIEYKCAKVSILGKCIVKRSIHGRDNIKKAFSRGKAHFWGRAELPSKQRDSKSNSLKMKSEVIRVLPQLENTAAEDAPVVQHLCFYCGTSHEVLLCNWCRQIYYCRKHQSIHRSRSKCFPFIVSRGCGGLRGRRLLASRDIKPGKCKKSPNHTV